MKCTNKTCDDTANTTVDFEWLTTLGMKRNEEYLCEKCANNLLIHGLANRKQLKFRLFYYEFNEEDYG